MVVAATLLIQRTARIRAWRRRHAEARHKPERRREIRRELSRVSSSGRPSGAAYAASAAASASAAQSGEDGKPRKLRVRCSKRGVVRATIVDEKGNARTEVSKPGEALTLEIPSGGFWASTGGGSGAYDELPWEHEPMATNTTSMAFIVDTGIPL